MAKKQNTKQTNKQEDERVLVMIGPAKTGYNHLNKPDQYEDKETGKKGPMQFTTQMILTAEQLDEIKDDIEAVIDEEYEKAKAKIEEIESNVKRKKALKKLNKVEPWIEHEDEDGEPDGCYVVRAKSKPNKRGKRRFGIFDCAGKATDVLVYGGSTIKLQAYVRGYYNPATGDVGATLYIQAVLVIELAGDTGGSNHNPFGEQEGGFVDSGDEDYSDEDNEDDADEDEENDDF